MKIVGVCGRKGGSGKTTTAVHLAAEMAARGLSTVLVDCDTQGSAKHWSGPGRLPMKVEHRPLEPSQNIGQWSAGIRSIAADYLILDSPPHLDAALGGVIGLSDVAVIPCGPSGLDLIATAETVGLVREIRTARGDGYPFITLIPNRVDVRTASGRQLEGALEDLGEEVGPAIHSRTVLADAFNLGVWVGEYAPGSLAHDEIKELAKHVISLLGRKPGKKKRA
jgi:chromosome partitioning protein